MIFEAMTVGSFLSNCYIIGSETTKEAAIIDPGADFDRIVSKLKEHGLTPYFSTKSFTAPMWSP